MRGQEAGITGARLVAWTFIFEFVIAIVIVVV